MSPELKIIGGKWRNRKISTMSGAYRPTTGIVKKSLFDILGADIVDASFLDLFAGSGAVGLEAMSRGANPVSFVEQSLPAINILKENLERLRAEKGTYEIIWQDYIKALGELRNKQSTFDYIFVDPPYHDTLPHRILGDVAFAKILAEDGLLIYEAARNDARGVLEKAPPELYPLREVDHGGTAILLFRWRDAHPDATDIETQELENT